MAPLSSWLVDVAVLDEERRDADLVAVTVGAGHRRRIREWCSEHVEIIDAILSEDVARASTLLHRHLTHTYEATSAAARAEALQQGRV